MTDRLPDETTLLQARLTSSCASIGSGRSRRPAGADFRRRPFAATSSIFSRRAGREVVAAGAATPGAQARSI
jgi:hypothetical protein